MSHATDSLEIAIGNALFLGQPFPTITQWQIALYFSAPDESGAMGSEISTSNTGYARQRQDPSTVNWLKKPEQDDSGRTVYCNAQMIQFPNPTASWGMVSYFGLIDQNEIVRFIAPLVAAKTIGVNDSAPVFMPGELEIAIG